MEQRSIKQHYANGLETKEEDGERSKGRRQSGGVERGKTTVYLTEGSSLLRQRKQRLLERMTDGTATAPTSSQFRARPQMTTLSSFAADCLRLRSSVSVCSHLLLELGS
ncbi:hypothetical protein ACLOJK_019361 [Asimina triloba]